MSKIESGSCPAAIRDNAASTKTDVFPVPGPPAINSGVARCAAALACVASSSKSAGAAGARVSFMEGVVI